MTAHRALDLVDAVASQLADPDTAFRGPRAASPYRQHLAYGPPGIALLHIDAGRLPQLAEFDTIRGLTGYGAYLLRRNPGSPTMRAVLDYCVRLTEPITHHGETLAGWWTETGPSGSPDDRFPGGHANSGMAHGIGVI